MFHISLKQWITKNKQTFFEDKSLHSTISFFFFGLFEVVLPFSMDVGALIFANLICCVQRQNQCWMKCVVQHNVTLLLHWLVNLERMNGSLIEIILRCLMKMRDSCVDWQRIAHRCKVNWLWNEVTLIATWEHPNAIENISNSMLRAFNWSPVFHVVTNGKLPFVHVHKIQVSELDMITHMHRMLMSSLNILRVFTRQRATDPDYMLLPDFFENHVEIARDFINTHKTTHNSVAYEFLSTRHWQLNRIKQFCVEHLARWFLLLR